MAPLAAPKPNHKCSNYPICVKEEARPKVNGKKTSAMDTVVLAQGWDSATTMDASAYVLLMPRWARRPRTQRTSACSIWFTPVTKRNLSFGPSAPIALRGVAPYLSSVEAGNALSVPLFACRARTLCGDALLKFVTASLRNRCKCAVAIVE